MRDLRTGVKLQKVQARQYDPLPFEYQLTPYEMLMDDIRSKRYKLRKVMVGAECGGSLKGLWAQTLMTPVARCRVRDGTFNNAQTNGVRDGAFNNALTNPHPPHTSTHADMHTQLSSTATACSMQYAVHRLVAQ